MCKQVSEKREVGYRGEGEKEGEGGKEKERGREGEREGENLSHGLRDLADVTLVPVRASYTFCSQML